MQYTVVVTVQYCKIYARWVSRAFTVNNKPARIMSCLSFPQRYGERKTAVYVKWSLVMRMDPPFHSTQEVINYGLNTPWLTHEEEVQSNTICQQSADRRLLRLTDLFLVDFLQHGHTVNADKFCATLKSLREVITRKRPGFLSYGLIHLQDYVELHRARPTQNLLQKFGRETLHCPPYNSDFTLRNYFFSPPRNNT